MEILIIVILTILFGWVMYSVSRRAKKEWDILDEFEKRVEKISNKEELDAFSKEFAEKARQIQNTYVKIRMMRIIGYMEGLYKHYDED